MTAFKFWLLLAALGLTAPAWANDFQHDGHNSHDSHDSHDHAHHESADANADTGALAPAAALTHTDDIDAALANGGEPIVADVLGVVCDFCATAMNKIFSKRSEVAAIYVDLDTKALNLVLEPGTQLSDAAIAELAEQAGYRVAAVRRGDAVIGG